MNPPPLREAAQGFVLGVTLFGVFPIVSIWFTDFLLNWSTK